MNRARNGERFSVGEHALYATCALGLVSVLLAAFALFFTSPSITTFLVALLVAAGAVWVRGETRRYAGSPPSLATLE